MKENRIKILLIDDQANILDSLSLLLEDQYIVFTAMTGIKGLEILVKENISIVFLDIILPDMGGLDVLEKIKQIDKNIEVIIATGVNTLKVAIEAMKKGAFDYISKPFESAEVLTVTKNALEKQLLLKELNYLRSEYTASFPVIVGKSKALMHIFEIAEKVSQNDSTVFISGESGTGKELIARKIHFSSLRRNKPFIAVNCAAITETLLESELFGHEKGSFTNASTTKEGKFELADKGTIFLDEVSSMSLGMQAKILRVIQEQELERVGGVKTIKIDVRVISCCNIDLKEAVSRGEFRADLFYRLNVVPIFVPPLRERKEDISLLLDYYIALFSRKFNKKVRGCSKEAMRQFKAYAWPGNIRELKNLVERLIALTDKSEISLEDIPFEIFINEDAMRLSMGQDKSLKSMVKSYEKRYIAAILKRMKGNRTKTAAFLELHRNTLTLKIAELEIN